MLTVAGRYRLLSLIASGGMGRVWRARDETLDRLVAVKEVLPPEGLPAADRRTSQLSTMREARAAARLEHPGVVRIYDVLHVTGRTWIVMEYVESQSLQQRLASDGPLPHREAARIGLAVLDALRAAHAAGVVHHDVKPANVLLADDGRIMLTDFGLATLDAAPAGDGTGTAPLLGSPYYVAPERLRGGDAASVGSDLWSLGATLYTAVEGRPPFDRPSVAESLAAVLVDDADPPRHPGPLHPVIAALMTRDPAERATASVTRDALHGIARPARGVSVVPKQRRPHDTEVRFRPAAVPPRGPQTDVATAGAPTGPRRSRTVVVSVAAAVLLTAGAAVAVPYVNDSRQRTESSGAAGPGGSGAVGATSVCDPAGRRPLSTVPGGSGGGALPDGWRSLRDTTGFVVAAPRDWNRAQRDAVVCIGAPDGSATFTVSGRPGVGGDPLRRWRDAETAALAAGSLPGYRRVAMGVLLVTGGGADWEYSWQPAAGPRLHTRRVLLSAARTRAFELSWTTLDRDWAAGLGVQRDLLATFRDSSGATPTWAVPAPE